MNNKHYAQLPRLLLAVAVILFVLAGLRPAAVFVAWGLALWCVADLLE